MAHRATACRQMQIGLQTDTEAKREAEGPDELNIGALITCT